MLESAPGRANVVARIGGTDPAAGALLLHGHLDVVPAEPGEWERDPFSGEIDDGVLYGRGAVDMKNADAVAARRHQADDGQRYPPAPRHHARLHRRRGGHRGLRGGVAGDQASRPVRGMHRGGRRVRRVHLPRRERRAAVPARVCRARDRLAETHRARPGWPRLQAEPSQCRGNARGGGHADRRLPLARAADPDGPGGDLRDRRRRRGCGGAARAGWGGTLGGRTAAAARSRRRAGRGDGPQQREPDHAGRRVQGRT